MIVSLYGSHASMLCDDMEHDTILGVDLILAGHVLLKDEKGYYVTYSSRLDNGLADVKRYNAARCVR